jgi:DNA-binding transcriptional regulator YdaS (Cro superfamily)
MPKLTPPSKSAKNGKMRSSPEARRLIRAYVKHYGSQHQAAKKLGMTQAQLNGLLTGRLRDTPAMRVAIDRADARAKRAWLKVNGDNCHVIDAPATLRAAARALQQAQVMIDMLLKVSET